MELSSYNKKIAITFKKLYKNKFLKANGKYSKPYPKNKK